MEYEETLEDVLKLLFPRAYKKIVENLLEISRTHVCPSNYILRKLVDVGAVRAESGGNRCVLIPDLGLWLIRLGLVWIFFVVRKKSVARVLAHYYVMLEREISNAIRD